MKKILTTTLLLASISIANASMDDCTEAAQNKNWDDVIEYCKPLADSNREALAFTGSAYAMLDNGEMAQNYLQKYVNKYKDSSDDKTSLANAYMTLGNLYYFKENYGAKRDIQKGLQYITKGAELGNAIAQYQLGTVYFNGDNAPVNYPTAYMWYTISAYNGDEDAKNNFFKENEATYLSQAPSCIAIGDNMVAKAYLDGKGGLPVSTAEAKEYLEKAISLYKQSKEPTANKLKYCKPVSDDLNLAGAQKLLASL
ncbi:tetratricopeptide repeat protein [Francisella philomiragia]|uniref:Sel1 repeat family protein n=1 Tax=Francisella philomiragia TaxID=28110 RepID=A0ABS1GEZ4_9GAMM|nr:SEL1-like repeat protein [Francisella philomiragia]MBK2259536.1 sel1 repeat family protein [Francisella philomiragia]MBK2303228.1 sel1 repeat family protein [Francisella philomiragia]